VTQVVPGRLTSAQLETLRWAASLGAVTAEGLAARTGTGLASARGRLLALRRRELLVSIRPLADRPTLFTVSRAGLRACEARGIDPARVSFHEANHMIVCAAVAAELEHRYPDHRLIGERELRRDERERGSPLASASLGAVGGGEARRHRPDLVLLPNGSGDLLPVAVEVELTVKADARLHAICRAWARCRLVAGVLYVVSQSAERPLDRAVQAAGARERIAIVSLGSVVSPQAHSRRTVATHL
jgi:hypothetical protein